MKPTVYIETTVISYLVAKLSTRLETAVDQTVTREWWQNVLPNCDPCISEYVLAEIRRGDQTVAEKRLKHIEGFKLLDPHPELEKLASTYSKKIDIPTRSYIDALHLAAASFYRLTYLISWNCTHIASGRVRRIIQEINQKVGLPTPVICTPRELMEV